MRAPVQGTGDQASLALARQDLFTKVGQVPLTGDFCAQATVDLLVIGAPGEVGELQRVVREVVELIGVPFTAHELVALPTDHYGWCRHTFGEIFSDDDGGR